jgi:FkbM family methyltransferase
MNLKRRLTTAVKHWAARCGYPIVPTWRLEKWEQSTHLRELFAMLEIDCVLDVGANIGQFQEFLRLHLEYKGRIVSFEPIGEMFEGLQRAAAADPLWSVHRLALGDTDGSATINVTAERTLSSLLPPNEERLEAMGYEKYLRETQVTRTETIPVRRLDAVLDDVVPAGSKRLFVKSDTQGYDMSVIRGAAGCLARIPAFQIELPVRQVYRGAPDYLTSLAQLDATGYELTGLFPVQRDATLRVVNLDAVMIRRDEAERLRAEGRHAPGHAHRP